MGLIATTRVYIRRGGGGVVNRNCKVNLLVSFVSLFISFISFIELVVMVVVVA
jgi:hypothetical protein